MNATPDFVEAGSACADLVANPKRWINRRVETVEMLSREETRRRVSIDFTLSEQQRSSLTTRHGLTVPISVLGKRPLRNFDLRDEDEGARPILGSADNRELALIALMRAAHDALGDPPPDDRVDAITADLQQIVYQDEPLALETLEFFVEAAESGDAMRAAVWDDPACRSLLRTFATDYVLFAALPPDGPARRVIKYSYGEDFPLDPPRARRTDAYSPGELWWRLRNAPAPRRPRAAASPARPHHRRQDPAKPPPGAGPRRRLRAVGIRVACDGAAKPAAASDLARGGYPVHLGDGAPRMVRSPSGAVASTHATMSKPATRIRTNGAYVIRSAASRPREIKASSSLNGHAPVVTPELRRLVQAVWQHARS